VVDATEENVDGDVEYADERFLLIGSTNAISQEAIQEQLSPSLRTLPVHIFPIPLVAPTSQEQATTWSAKYWPTVYKKTNSFGPHPSLYERAAAEIKGDVDRWMELAREVADEACKEGRGESVGVVVVERRDGEARVRAVAGDARSIGWSSFSRGNPTAHAVMRAIGMISEGLRIAEDSSASTSIMSPSIFHDQPLSVLEREYNCHSTESGGYLCHDLEIYCTHEPCVMCSMAIVHSRFKRLVFGKRMPRSGGVCADGELGHGLWWRKELNWNLLAWQWDGNRDGEERDAEDGELEA
jgi:tRNA-specific adenosine deaminase 3